MTDRPFVYGTLAPGRPNAHVLADLEATWEPAYVTGTLWEQGCSSRASDMNACTRRPRSRTGVSAT
jgi:gamma-glutamylcyclotransferase (GGCT)/AIG2-like uncharacterized protein YtfP